MVDVSVIISDTYTHTHMSHAAKNCACPANKPEGPSPAECKKCEKKKVKLCSALSGTYQKQMKGFDHVLSQMNLLRTKMEGEATELTQDGCGTYQLPSRYHKYPSTAKPYK